MAKSEGSEESAKTCAALVDKLCASSATIKASVVSTDMFLVMAVPRTAGVALKLIEEKGVEVDSEIVTLLLSAQPTQPTGEIVTVRMVADDFIDEVFYDGEGIRSKLSNPDGGCSWKEVNLDYVPGAVLAVAAHDSQSGGSAGFSLEAKSETVDEWNFDVNAGDGSNVKVFGIDGPDNHHGPMKRPKHKQPPIGWTDNSFDDGEWGIPDGTKVQYSCWYQSKTHSGGSVPVAPAAARHWTCCCSRRSPPPSSSLASSSPRHSRRSARPLFNGLSTQHRRFARRLHKY
jgi:hypothetical protein